LLYALEVNEAIVSLLAARVRFISLYYCHCYSRFFQFSFVHSLLDKISPPPTPFIRRATNRYKRGRKAKLR
jgi:hypothetical protein